MNDTELQRFTYLRSQGARSLDRGEYSDAEVWFEDAMEIAQGWVGATSSPDALWAYGVSLMDLSRALHLMGAEPESEDLLREACTAFRIVARVDAEHAESALADALVSLAKVYRGSQTYVDFNRPPMLGVESMRQFRLEKLAAGTWSGPMAAFASPEWNARGEAPLQEAIPLLRRLVRADRTRFEPMLALSLNLLGELYLTLDRPTEAEAPLREAAAMLRGLADRDPGFESLLADTLQQLSKVGNSVGPTDRISELEELVPFLRREASLTSEEIEHGVSLAKSSARHRLMTALKELADLYREDGREDDYERVWNSELGTLMTEVLTIRRD